MHALATFELADYRRRLERAIASLGTRNPAPPVLADLRARLGQVLAEQEDRAGIAHAWG